MIKRAARGFGLFFALVGMVFALSACAATAPDVPVVSSGTPERNDANPGAADSPYAKLTGAQPRKY